MPGDAPSPEVLVADLSAPVPRPPVGGEPRHRLVSLLPPAASRAAAPVSMSRWPGVMQIFGSRRSAPSSDTSAAEVHVRPSADSMTRSLPSGETWAAPSRKTQNQRSLKRVRSVKALCGAASQIFTDSIIGTAPRDRDGAARNAERMTAAAAMSAAWARPVRRPDERGCREQPVHRKTRLAQDGHHPRHRAARVRVVRRGRRSSRSPAGQHRPARARLR